jgi:hypothetical protein
VEGAREGTKGGYCREERTRGRDELREGLTGGKEVFVWMDGRDLR